jgi:hypothetical protein
LEKASLFSTPALPANWGTQPANRVFFSEAPEHQLKEFRDEPLSFPAAKTDRGKERCGWRRSLPVPVTNPCVNAIGPT